MYKKIENVVNNFIKYGEYEEENIENEIKTLIKNDFDISSLSVFYVPNDDKIIIRVYCNFPKIIDPFKYNYKFDKEIIINCVRKNRLKQILEGDEIMITDNFRKDGIKKFRLLFIDGDEKHCDGCDEKKICASVEDIGGTVSIICRDCLQEIVDAFVDKSEQESKKKTTIDLSKITVDWFKDIFLEVTEENMNGEEAEDVEIEKDDVGDLTIYFGINCDRYGHWAGNYIIINTSGNITMKFVDSPVEDAIENSLEEKIKNFITK